MRRSRGLWVGANAVGATGTVIPTVDRPPIPAAVFLLVMVYSPAGRPLGELQTHGGPDRLTWQVDGHATIRLSLHPGVLTDKPGLLTPGNRVVIHLSNGLPPWAGIIDLPIEKTGDAVDVTCYSAEYLLTWALTPRYALYEGDSGATPRGILIDLMEKVDTAGMVGVLPPYQLPQEPDSDEETAAFEFAYHTLAAAADALRSVDSRLHYFLRPVGEDALLFETVAYRDAIKTPAAPPRLVEGRNLTSVAALEQGPIVNEVFAARSGADLSDPAEFVPTAFDANSMARYGRRQEFISVPEGAAAGRSPGSIAQRLVDHQAGPRLRFRGVALNLTPGPFTELGLGRRAVVELQTGDPLDVAIIGMEWDTNSNTLTLVVEYNEELILWD